MNSDTPQLAKKRAREMRTISQMVALACSVNHPAQSRTHTAHCGEPVCAECAALDAYAVERTLRCRKMGVKTTCEECENRCYQPQMREQIRAVMRCAGPRMITKHPVAAIRHLLGR